MRAKTLEELQIWQRAGGLVEAVSALTAASGAIPKGDRLRSQFDDAADSLLSNIAEGYGQGTDRAFARYLYIARGSANEIRSHLVSAVRRRLVDRATAGRLDQEALELSKMISAFIRYLLQSDWKDRY